jgi:hypothetical protein
VDRAIRSLMRAAMEGFAKVIERIATLRAIGSHITL